MAKLIFGCGYLGSRVAKRWLSAGEAVYAVTRTPKRATGLTAIGIQPIVGDVAGPSQIGLPKDVTTVLFAVGYERTSSHKIHDVYAGGIARVIDSLPTSVERFLYISSTGVYGQVAGSEVDENSPCQPTREGGKACLAAEDTLRTSRLADQAIILRLAGIYGPGRIPRSSDLLAGKPIDAPATGWLNLIHVDDAAAVVLLAEQHAPLPSLYVVSDGQPVIRGDYYRAFARLLGAPMPQFTTPAEGSPAAARAGSDKRVNPAKMLAELKPQLAHPSYREGLAAIVAGTSIAP